MSLKYTYRNVTSLLLTIVIAWNSFGYIGMMLSSIALHEMQHNDDQCEKMFCYCEVSEGQKICVCHHNDDQMMPNYEHHGPMDCILDMNVKDLVHDTTLIKWDNRSFILFQLISPTPEQNSHTYSELPSPKVPPGFKIGLDRPPPLV